MASSSSLDTAAAAPAPGTFPGLSERRKSVLNKGGAGRRATAGTPSAAPGAGGGGTGVGGGGAGGAIDKRQSVLSRRVEWMCPACLLMNDGARSRCEGCNSTRPIARDPHPHAWVPGQTKTLTRVKHDQGGHFFGSTDALRLLVSNIASWTPVDPTKKPEHGVKLHESQYNEYLRTALADSRFRGMEMVTCPLWETGQYSYMIGEELSMVHRIRIESDQQVVAQYVRKECNYWEKTYRLDRDHFDNYPVNVRQHFYDAALATIQRFKSSERREAGVLVMQQLIERGGLSPNVRFAPVVELSERATPRISITSSGAGPQILAFPLSPRSLDDFHDDEKRPASASISSLASATSSPTGATAVSGAAIPLPLTAETLAALGSSTPGGGVVLPSNAAAMLLRQHSLSIASEGDISEYHHVLDPTLILYKPDSTLFELAVAHEYWEMVFYLASQGAIIRREKLTRGLPELLVFLAERCHYHPALADVITQFIHAGLDPNVVSEDHTADPLLIWTIREHIAVFAAEPLVEGGALVDLSNAVGQTALMFACQLGQLDVIRVLLSLNANVWAMDGSERTPLVWALTNRQAAAVHLLLDRGARLIKADSEINEWTENWVKKQTEDDDICHALRAALHRETFLPLLMAGEEKSKTTVASTAPVPASGAAGAVTPTPATATATPSTAAAKSPVTKDFFESPLYDPKVLGDIFSYHDQPFTAFNSLEILVHGAVENELRAQRESGKTAVAT